MIYYIKEEHMHGEPQNIFFSKDVKKLNEVKDMIPLFFSHYAGIRSVESYSKTMNFESTALQIAKKYFDKGSGSIKVKEIIPLDKMRE